MEVSAALANSPASSCTVAVLTGWLSDYFSATVRYQLLNDEVAIQVQRNKVLIEVELSLVDENVDVEHFFAMMHGS